MTEQRPGWCSWTKKGLSFFPITNLLNYEGLFFAHADIFFSICKKILPIITWVHSVKAFRQVFPGTYLSSIRTVLNRKKDTRSANHKQLQNVLKLMDWWHYFHNKQIFVTFVSFLVVLSFLDLGLHNGSKNKQSWFLCINVRGLSKTFNVWKVVSYKSQCFPKSQISKDRA